MWIPVLRAIFANIVVAGAAFGFGTSILQLLPNSFSRRAKFVCVMIGGFGILGLVLFVIGHLSFTRWTVGIILAIGLGMAAISKLRRLDIPRPIAVFPAAMIAVVLVMTALSGLLEPVGDWNVDGVAYHLVGSKVWLREGVVRPIPDNMNTSYPCTVEMVFAGLYAFGGDRAAGFSAVWTLPLLLGIAASLGRRCGLGCKEAWWVAALLIAMPTVYNASIGAFIDGIYAAIVLAAIRIGLDAHEKKHFAAFGILCGLAMATKYPALVAVPVLICCAAWRPEHTRSIRGMIPGAAVAAGAACLVALPIYLKNWIFLGSPIYPPPAWAARFLHVKYFPTDAIREFYAYNIRRGNGHGRGIIHFFTLPFNLTYHTADFSGAGGIGLAPLAFAPFGIFASRGALFARRLAVVAFLLLLLWFATMQESRYLIHFYGMSAIFAVLGWRFVSSFTATRGKILCAIVLAISFSYGFFMIPKPQLPNFPAFFSAARAEQRRRAGIPFVESFDYLNQDASVTRLLIIDRSVLTYYSDKNYVKPFGQWGEQVFPDIATAAEILPKLKELHISHILDVQSTISGFRIPPDYPGLVMVFERPGQRIYKVERTPLRDEN
ncbi:MAG TPA: glycosyltransferase 87 family protein [Candidatus Acidoferrum sp.]|jgi:hypothetical protein